MVVDGTGVVVGAGVSGDGVVVGEDVDVDEGVVEAVVGKEEQYSSSPV